MSELEQENKALKEKIEILEQRVKELEEKNTSYVERQNNAQRKYHQGTKTCLPLQTERNRS
jgi:cell division septum initiation protein DivIVA